MNVRHKSITLPVPPGATKGWVKAQKQEMIKRLIEDIPKDKGFTIRKQWTDKSSGRWMTVIADIQERHYE